MKLPFLFAILGIVPAPALADGPPGPGEHYLDRCAKVVNMADFPDIVLVRNTSGGPCNPREGTLVESGKCLTAYKFCTMGIYFISKEKFKTITVGHLNMKPKPVQDSYFVTEMPADLEPLMAEFPHAGEIIPDSDHRRGESLEFSVKKEANGSYLFYKSKAEITYNDGTPATVAEFNGTEYGTHDFKPPPSSGKFPPGSWDWVLCQFHIRSDCK
jgi:hypothetical protein